MEKTSGRSVLPPCKGSCLQRGKALEHRNPLWRVGLAAAVLAAGVQLCHAGVPERVVSFLTRPETAAFLIYLGTGRDVRFSASEEAFSPDFMESPPATALPPKETPLPDFSGAALPELYYAVSRKPDVQALLAEPLSWDLTGEAPTVLILHTHSTESYTKDGQAYAETSRWRTLDENYNMLSVGSRVAELLTRQGICVLQDRQVYDHPSYNGSYTRARKAIGEYLEEYPSIQLVLDLHRDASSGEGGQMRTLAQVEGRASAQLMVVLGTNHKAYEKNLSLGLKLHALLEEENPGIMRPLQLRSQRFNQDLSPGALLIEVGAAGNTQEEALLAAEKLAEAVAALAKGTK